MSTFKKKPVTDKAEIINGRYDPDKDWEYDTKGYFLIRIDRGNNRLELGYCRESNIIEIIIYGNTPQEVYFTAIQKNLLSRLDHAAYLGKELEKAYIALKNNMEYVQDEELNFKGAPV